MIKCDDDEELDPTSGCGCINSERLRRTYYPSWATEYDIILAASDGLEKLEQLEQVSQNRIEVCPIAENKGKCDYDSGKYWNELGCECFYIGHCGIRCPEGEQFLPTESCTCVRDSEVDALYPDWASNFDKRVAIK